MVIIDDDNSDDDDDDDEDDADADDDDDDDTLVTISHHHRCRPYLFYIRFKVTRPDWRRRGCVVMIIIMTVGDAEDAR